MQEALLVAENLNAGYGTTAILHHVSVAVPSNGIVCLLGANGAGKTTLLRALSGVVSTWTGGVTFDGRDITAMGPEARVRIGLCQVPEGRHLFSSLSVLDNLLLGGFTVRRRFGSRPKEDEMDAVFALFPVLRERQHQIAGSLSGGEQQMLAIGRALMARPIALLLDEPSLGLAPILTKRIFTAIADLANKQGLAILLAEQNAIKALAIAQQGYVIERGRVILEGRAEELLGNPDVVASYLGGRG